VDHGIVLVRGERVPGGSVRLTAGTSFELPAISASLADEGVAAPLPSSGPAADVTPEVSNPVPATAAPTAAASLSAASSLGVPEPRDGVDRALRAADVARREGDVTGAIRSFQAAWQHAPAGDPRRGLAALSLARLQIAGQPAQAAQILRSSLSDMPQALLEDASVRLVEAESRAGNHDAARRAADDYSRRFPAGRRAEEVRRWSNP
jgi:hypothetical protein